MDQGAFRAKLELMVALPVFLDVEGFSRKVHLRITVGNIHKVKVIGLA